MRFLTVAEVASMMRVSKMTVYRLVHSGELPAVRVGRSFRVPEQAVDDYRRNRVGFVYQSYNLIGNLSAIENVLLPYIPTGLTSELRSKAAELLKESTS